MGLLRIVLALSVIAGHSETTLFGLIWVDELYAVQAFFTISGFYMAMVLNGRYAGLPVWAFYKSRALRIYPGYFVGAVLAFLASHHEIIEIVHGMTRPTRLWFYLQNATLFGQDLSYIVCMRDKAGGCIRAVTTNIDPPAWSLAVELAFYAVAPFVVRQPRRIVVLIAAGTLYLLLTNAVTFPVTGPRPFYMPDSALRFQFYPASFIFFGAGALAFHLRTLTIGATYAVLVAAVAAFGFIDTAMPPWHLMLFALALPELFRLTQASRHDRLLGEFSYPLYILHWPVLILVKRHQDALAPVLAYASVATVVAVLTAGAAAALFLLVDRPMDRLRRPAATERPAPAGEPAWGRALLVAYLSLPFAVVAAVLR